MLSRISSLVLGGTLGGAVGFAKATQVATIAVPLPITPNAAVTVETIIYAFAALVAIWVLRQFIETRDNSRRLIVYAFGQPEENGKGGMTGMFEEQKERTVKLEAKIEKFGAKLSNLPCREDPRRADSCERTE